jgi:phage-related protein
MEGLKELPTFFYRTSTGREPVSEWLKELDPADRKVVGDDIRDCEFASPVGLPLCRPITGRRGLWEIRNNLPGRRIARVLFCIEHGHMVLLHGLIKKSQRTPNREIELAVQRMKEGS